MGTHEGTGRSRRPLRVVAVVLGSSIVALVVAELLLAGFAPVDFHRPWRLKGAPWSRLHRAGTLPGLAFELAPDAAVEIELWKTTVHTNSEGMRGPEVERSKPPGVIRIAAVGDSFTFGHGVADDETFPRHLQRLLDERTPERRYEVLNFGVSGYSTHDEAIVVRHKVLAFDPDLILLCYVLNDPEVRADQPMHRAYREPELWQRLNLTRWLVQRREARAIARWGGRFRYLHGAKHHWSTVLAAFEDVADAASEAGVPVTLVLMPLVDHEKWKPYPQAGLHAQVAAAGARHGFAVLDLRLPLAALAPMPRSLRLDFDAHPSSEGNRLIARAILDFLRSTYSALF